MPVLSETTRAQRRQHIVDSALRCFARDGFQATSMEAVIAEAGMSSASVYRYFRSKEELIHACAEGGVAKVRGIFVELLERDDCPTPGETMTLLVTQLHARTDNPDFDMTRIALQTWAEAVRDPVLQTRARELYLDTLGHIGELADRWRVDGHIPPDADAKAVAASLFSLMHGLIVMHHLVEDVSQDALRVGVAVLGAAVAEAGPSANSIHRERP